MAPSAPPALPAEVLFQIVAYCDPVSWKQLALVSRRWSQASLSRLYHTVRYLVHPVFSFPCGPLEQSSPIYDLRLFHRSIATSPELRSLVVEAYLTWDEATEAQEEGAHSPSQLPSGSVGSVQDVATLLGRSETFKVLHLSLPRPGSPMPFLVPMVTSIRTMLSLRHPKACPDYGRLMRLFEIPTLRHVDIDYANWWNCSVPSELWQRGISNVTSLALMHSGPPSEDLGHVLSWMNDLRSVHIEVDSDYDYLRACHAAGGKTTSEGLLSALEQQKDKLQEIFLRFDYPPHYRVTRKAFRDYKALKRLDVPLGLLMKPKYAGDVSLDSVTPPIHEILPSSLHELLLQLQADFPLYTISDDGTINPTIQSHQLFDWLSDIPELKAQEWPQLRRVTLSKDPQKYERFSGGYPADCEEYTAVRRRFDLSNVELRFA